MDNVMISYDLRDANEKEHAAAMDLLLAAGFKRDLPATGNGMVPLPQTTVVGATAAAADTVRDWTWDSFEALKLKPKRVAVLKHGESPSAKYSS